MANRDIEDSIIHPGQTTQNLDSSSESSESLESYSERISLLPPDFESESSNYKSTEVVITESSETYDEGSSGELPRSKSVFGILSLLFIGVFIANADGTLVLATYGTISSEFKAFGDASWLTTSFSLAVCATQPLTGKLSDIYGRKGVLIASYILFAAGSIICGIAGSMRQVIAGRVISGIGAAGMTVLVSVLITDLVPLIQVASWRSYVNVGATLGRSIGGPLGGLLADTIGWRWSFIGQGPLITLAIILVALELPGQNLSPASTIQRKGKPSKLRRIDFIGAFSLALTIVSLLGALSLGGQKFPWLHPLVISPLIASLIIGVFFVIWETKRAIEPVLPPSLIIQRDVATNYGILTLQTSAQIAMMYSVPLYFRATQNSTNTAAGSHLFPAVAGNAVGGLLAGYAIQKTGRYKNLTILAAMFSSISYLLLIFRWNGHISLLESLEIIPGGFGQGVASSSTFIALTSSVKPNEMAMATAGMYLSSSAGMVVSLAVCSSVQMGTLKFLLEQALRYLPNAGEVIDAVMSDVSKIAGLEESLRKVVVECYVKSLEYSHMVSLACSLLALGLALTVREHRLS